jgi:amino acid transporter
LSIEPSWFHTRLVAFSCLSFICLVHGTLLKWGVRLQNALGLIKLIVLALISVSGLLSLAGFKHLQVREGYEKPDNFSWHNFWEGSGTGANAFVSGLYNVIWYVCRWRLKFHILNYIHLRSFVGYSNANYVLSEVRDPVHTIKRAAPLAMFSVTVVYLFINVAYFSVVSKKDILKSRQTVAFVR